MCLLLSYAHAQTSDYDKGLAAFNAKDFKTTIAQLTPYALKGNCTAQFAVGFSYMSDYDIKNDSLAIHWLSLAAEQKQVRAMGPLAACYFAAEQAPDHLVKAYLWAMLGANYDPAQQLTTTTLLVRAYMKPEELERATHLVDDYERRWHRKPDCQ
jgi:TPR repeat protein